MLKLKPFQEEGVQHLIDKLDNDGLHAAIIGDEMGLGKTAQALSYIKCTPGILYTLIICPASLLNPSENWAHECKLWMGDDPRFSQPSVTGRRMVRSDAFNICSSGKSIPQLGDRYIAKNISSPAPRGFVYMVSYDTFKTKWGISTLASVQWDLVIVDEFQKMKNMGAENTKAIHKLVDGNSRPRRFIFTSATPADKIGDYFSICHFLDPIRFHSKRMFDMTYGKPGREEEAAREINRFLSRYMIRRKKSDVDKTIPPKIITIEPIVLPPDSMSRIEEMMITSTQLGSLVEKSREALDLMEYIRQTTVDGEPVSYDLVQQADKLYNESWGSVKRVNYKIFDSIAAIRREIGIEKALPAFERMMQIIQPEQQAVVFYHHVSVGDILDSLFQSEGISVSRVDGSTNKSLRSLLISDFKSGRNQVYLGSIESNNAGINLQNASLGFLVEPPWMYITLAQAVDRIHRIGSKKTVDFRYIVAERTLDEHIINILSLKKVVSETVMDKK